MTAVSGTEGYAEAADVLFAQYESITFEQAQGSILHLIPPAACRILEIGAGTGRDAAGFAALGHSVVAVEPTDAFRSRAATRHPSPAIEWLDDSLPDLAQMTARGEAFDVVLMNAVWMHLDTDQRHRAMPNVAALMRPRGIAIMTLRHGPVPPGRRMFQVTADETIGLARRSALDVVLNAYSPNSVQKTPGVSWTRLIFAKPPLAH